MLPVEVQFEEFVEIPVETDVDHLGFIGPEHRVGQAAREHLPAQLKLAEACGDLERPQAKMARPEINGFRGSISVRSRSVSPVRMYPA
jgi:hypothetical protein